MYRYSSMRSLEREYQVLMMANARPLASTDFGGGIESVHSHDALDPAVSRYEYGTCFQYTPALYCTSINQSIRIYWNEPVYHGHYYSFNTHTMRAFALPGMPGLAYASYWPLGQFYYNLIWLVINVNESVGIGWG